MDTNAPHDHDRRRAPRRGARNRTRHALLIVGGVALFLFASSCAESDSEDITAQDDPGDSEIVVSAEGEGEEPPAQPQVGTETFGQGDFGDIPLIDGSEQIGPIDVQGDEVMAATYTVNQMVAARAIDRMAGLLDRAGWNQLIAPVERPEGAFRTEYAKDGRRVEVVATDVTGLGNDNRMQYSVILHPDLDDTDVDAGRASTD
jgi:hypothetical protein